MTNLLEIIQTELTWVLKQFTLLDGMCLGASVALCERLSRFDIQSYVALGTLTCKGITTYKYEPLNLETSGSWAGHAWCVIENKWIADITLLRTARVLSRNSNLKNCLLPLLNKGAIAFKKQGDVSIYDQLNYTEEAKLPELGYARLLEGLMTSHGYI